MVKKTRIDIGGVDTGNDPENKVGAEMADPPDPKEDLAARLEAKEKEALENYDKYVRAVAELDNFRKRCAKEKTDLLKFGNENLLRDILPMVDNLDRALKHAAASCDFESFKKGLELLRSQLICSLEKHGLEAIDCEKNKTFDPNFHEAVLQVESKTHESNQIVDEFEKGYLLHGRLLRPSKVSVSKRGETKDC
ncbi:MAG: nucleotide exchange factor GrpE [Syntrophales bacterium]|nr:nucleotide exchange factor GrpE [Syntrophales bacterium]